MTRKGSARDHADAPPTTADAAGERVDVALICVNANLDEDKDADADAEDA